jgi:hypothetical protein
MGTSLRVETKNPLDDLDFEMDSDLLQGLKLSGYEDKATRSLLQAQHLLQKSKMASLRPLLPLLLNLKGDPYTLDRYFPFEPFFRTRTPRKTLLKTGRQVSKSTSLASQGIVHSNCSPYYSTLYIAPLYETIRRFSQNYIRPFIETSPVRSLFVSAKTINSVLQRTFLNHSQMLFSFAFLDAERTRGVSADENSYDEIQNLDKDFIPIIRETMSGSRYGGRESFAGTPLSLENTIESLWLDSSQAEWLIRCTHCTTSGYPTMNIPALAYHLDKMIGPWREDISTKKPAVICHKCGGILYPQTGRWVHAFPDRRWTFAGYHVPQIIMPMHYGDPEKWSALLAKRMGKGNTPVNVFYNEVCGESYDTGSRVLTLTELRAAANLPWSNTVDQAKTQIHNYIHRVLTCDWGGGGEDGVSYTKMAVLGMLPDGKIHCLWGHQSLQPHDHLHEAKLVLAALNKFQCHAFVHDYTGAGSLRETFVVQAGWPIERVIPIAYQRAASGDIMTWHEATDQHPRDYWIADKSRSLMYTCAYIKMGWLRFFKDDYEDADNQGLLRDFLALVDEKVDSRTARDMFLITRDPNMSDDFAQAVNMGCCALWKMSGKWPNLAQIAALKVTQSMLNKLHPPVGQAWTDIDL